MRWPTTARSRRFGCRQTVRGFWPIWRCTKHSDIAPAPDEVEVRVRAAGINFRDVMKALGTHPGNPLDLLWLGDDFSGSVERVGAL